MVSRYGWGLQPKENNALFFFFFFFFFGRMVRITICQCGSNSGWNKGPAKQIAAKQQINYSRDQLENRQFLIANC
ncbi:hypothetical protein F4813DRAFT_368450 [Daldinia decipiens]|uniref:uncharacterized protein n=1 Tax=Daldinia decipiens TaxID=326647 RepID=UPI0020C23173|nr:uncharacterized protein F4813DRAFT_368450 [Daldinia decipiens]KAI1655057.1 hypothetical protein F4813DRAFT_368450 [Daldinia decipiens]